MSGLKPERRTRSGGDDEDRGGVEIGKERGLPTGHLRFSRPHLLIEAARWILLAGRLRGGEADEGVRAPLPSCCARLKGCLAGLCCLGDLL